MTGAEKIEDESPESNLFFSPFVGSDIEFRLFDPQNCEYIQASWIADASGLSLEEIERMTAEGLLQPFKSPNGKDGFLLYTEFQARTAKTMLGSGRYSLAELQHIFSDWNSHLEFLSADDFAYDSFDIDNYTHFRRRLKSQADFFEDDLASMNEGTHWLKGEELAAQKALAEQKLKRWRSYSNYFARREENDLSEELKINWPKQLHHFRYADEVTRMMTSYRISEQIVQGYSVEITFNGFKWGKENQLMNLHWPSTLNRLKETRNEGKIFPLRTPEFNLTENGLQLLNPLSPEAYKALHEKYRLDELSRLIAERGPALWQCDLEAAGRGACAECGAIFERTTSSRQYCGDRCRGRAKSRRWRESDPERARQAQAKHYKEAYPDD